VNYCHSLCDISRLLPLCVFIDATSESDSGSVIATAVQVRPLATSGSQRFFCSSRAEANALFGPIVELNGDRVGADDLEAVDAMHGMVQGTT